MFIADVELIKKLLLLGRVDYDKLSLDDLLSVSEQASKQLLGSPDSKPQGKVLLQYADAMARIAQSNPYNCPRMYVTPPEEWGVTICDG